MHWSLWVLVTIGLGAVMAWAVTATVWWDRARRDLADVEVGPTRPFLGAVATQLRGWADAKPLTVPVEPARLPDTVVVLAVRGPKRVDWVQRRRGQVHRERVGAVQRFWAGMTDLPRGLYYVNVEDIDVYVPGVPVLSFNVQKERWGQDGLVIPDPYFMAFKAADYRLRDQVPKTESRAIFRGATTGLPWHDGHGKRVALARYAQAHPDLDVKLHCVAQTPDCKAQLADVLAPSMSVGRQLAHRFVVSVDGNGAAWNRVVWQLRSRCLLFWESSFVHFVTLKMEPYQHYVPYRLEVDPDTDEVVCDLAEQVARFSKDPEGAVAIADQATLYAQAHITLANARAYTVHLLQGLAQAGLVPPLGSL